MGLMIFLVAMPLRNLVKTSAMLSSEALSVPGILVTLYGVRSTNNLKAKLMNTGEKDKSISQTYTGMELCPRVEGLSKWTTIRCKFSSSKDRSIWVGCSAESHFDKGVMKIGDEPALH